MARLLLDAPALPQPAVATFLLEVAQQEGEWATLALSCARDLVMHRIPDRWAPDAVVLAQQDREWAISSLLPAASLVVLCKPGRCVQTALSWTSIWMRAGRSFSHALVRWAGCHGLAA